jgi:hypothetical protein
MIGYYFIQNKYLYVGNNDKDRDINGNDKYTKEMKSPPDKPAAEPVSSIRMKESFDTEEDENENLIHNNKNKGDNIATTYKKLLRYIFLIYCTN